MVVINDINDEQILDEILEQDLIVWKGDYTRILGYSYEEMGKNAQSWLNLVHPDDVSRVVTEFESIFNKESFFAVEYRLSHADGHYLWVVARGIIIYNQQTGQPERTIGVVFDITDHKQAQEAKENLEKEYKRIIETTI